MLGSVGSCPTPRLVAPLGFLHLPFAPTPSTLYWLRLLVNFRISATSPVTSSTRQHLRNQAYNAQARRQVCPARLTPVPIGCPSTVATSASTACSLPEVTLSQADRPLPRFTKMTSSPSGNTLLLKRQLTELRKRPVDGFSAGLKDESNLFEWEIMIIGPNDTLYEGGFLRAELIFPPEYPLLPPKMKFITPMWHPNIYADGTVCISILHAPGKDEYGYEDASERWLPVHTVESILISVISLLSADVPNTDSPANIDAAKQVREDLTGYKKKVRRLVRQSAEEAFD
ncbi:ubiquitin-conjugating enzyme [Moesziomyces antarcticus]|uniref:E2 ubiquitin-conjugating enzyme n=2 Tax=Pseudozyma antarctica TaxID=84753 RepID=A0A081CEH2_PSEA2|nr:ubiquitin-conjugating enzyme [Moesziomyces antarcticus]GAK65068.1 ubiquitin-conjugating enzyme [Moesziomyces antarcticus]